MLKLYTCRLLFSFLPVLVIASCNSDTATGPEGRTSDELNFLHVAYGTPPLTATRVSFYAVKGKATGVDLYFHAAPGSSDSLRLLSFRVGSNSLDRRPDGSAIVPGDSLLISLTVSDPYHLVVDFQPAGLSFATSEPPTLVFSWAACGDDLNYDGKVDATDDQVAGNLGIWRQESANLPWFRQDGVISKSARQVTAQIPGFTGYALAF